MPLNNFSKVRFWSLLKIEESTYKQFLAAMSLCMIPRLWMWPMADNRWIPIRTIWNRKI